jgi:hypothetical protein
MLRDLLGRAPFPDIADELVAMRAERCGEAQEAAEPAPVRDSAAGAVEAVR